MEEDCGQERFRKWFEIVATTCMNEPRETKGTRFSHAVRETKHGEEEVKDGSCEEPFLFNGDRMFLKVGVIHSHTTIEERKYALTVYRLIRRVAHHPFRELDCLDLAAILQSLVSTTLKNINLVKVLYDCLFYFSRQTQREEVVRVLYVISFTFPSPQSFRRDLLDELQHCASGLSVFSPIFEMMTDVENQIKFSHEKDDLFPTREQLKLFCSWKLRSCRVLLPDRRWCTAMFHPQTTAEEVVAQILKKSGVSGAKGFVLTCSLAGVEITMVGSRLIQEALDEVNLKEEEEDLCLKRVLSGLGYKNEDIKSLLWSFMQSRSEYFRGLYPIESTAAAELSAFSIQASCGRSCPLGTDKWEKCLRQHTPPNICLSEGWESSVKQYLGGISNFSKERARSDFLQKMEGLAVGHCHVFSEMKATKATPLMLPINQVLSIGINEKGLHVFDNQRQIHFASINLTEIRSLAVCETAIQFRVETAESAFQLQLETRLGAEICWSIQWHRPDLEITQFQEDETDEDPQERSIPESLSVFVKELKETDEDPQERSIPESLAVFVRKRKEIDEDPTMNQDVELSAAATVILPGSLEEAQDRRDTVNMDTSTQREIHRRGVKEKQENEAEPGKDQSGIEPVPVGPEGRSPRKSVEEGLSPTVEYPRSASLDMYTPVVLTAASRSIELDAAEITQEEGTESKSQALSVQYRSVELPLDTSMSDSAETKSGAQKVTSEMEASNDPAVKKYLAKELEDEENTMQGLDDDTVHSHGNGESALPTEKDIGFDSDAQGENENPEMNHSAVDASELLNEVHGKTSTKSIPPGTVSEVHAADGQSGDPFEKVDLLIHGTIFANKYKVKDDQIEGLPYWKNATELDSKKRVVLKFCESREQFQKMKDLYEQLSSRYVCQLLAAKEEEGYPPCLIFERGDETLEEWMAKESRELETCRFALSNIVKALASIHDQEIVHRDLQPHNIVLFWSEQVWKISNFEKAELNGERCSLEYTLPYAPPEIVKAKEEGRPSIVTKPSSDLWTFGIISFELLAGRPYYGESASDDQIHKCLCGKNRIPPVGTEVDDQDRPFLKNLLQVHPWERTAAKDVLHNASFASERDDMHRAQLNRIEQVLCTVAQETWNANVMVTIELEEFSDPQDAHLPSCERKTKEALTAEDENLNDPVYVLNIHEAYRMRVRLKHQHQGQENINAIESIQVQPPDNDPVNLVVDFTHRSYDAIEVCADLNLAKVRSNRLLWKSPAFGRLDEKYVPLRITVAVRLNPEIPSVSQLRGTVYCCMVEADNPLRMKRFVRSAKRMWNDAPQWARDSARGVVILASIAAELGPAAVLGQPPSIFFRILKVLKKIFVLKCCD